MIRVLIADDHAIVRAGLARVLQAVDDISVVEVASNGLEAVAAAREHRPDVVLIDLEMPELDGIEATRQIVQLLPGVPVIVLTMFSDRRRILAALDAGAVGYLLKDAEPKEIVAGLHSAVGGGSPIDPKAARELVSDRRERPADTLTAREREILVLLTRGYANKKIALELGISEKTVKTHLTSVFRRINAFDRTQAALWAERNGLLDDEPPAEDAG